MLSYVNRYIGNHATDFWRDKKFLLLSPCANGGMRGCGAVGGCACPLPPYSCWLVQIKFSSCPEKDRNVYINLEATALLLHEAHWRYEMEEMYWFSGYMGLKSVLVNKVMKKDCVDFLYNSLWIVQCKILSLYPHSWLKKSFNVSDPGSLVATFMSSAMASDTVCLDFTAVDDMVGIWSKLQEYRFNIKYSHEYIRPRGQIHDIKMRAISNFLD